MSKTYNIFSWNVNGIRAVLKKGALQKLMSEKAPDILCLQETKARPEQLSQSDSEALNDGYFVVWNPAKRPGYSGTAILAHDDTAPLDTWLGMGENYEIAHDWEEDRYGSPMDEGRVLTMEFEEFYLVTVYTPNSKPDLSRLILREKLWDPTFLDYLKELEYEKPVVVCGDFNAAHTEIDLARPKENEKNAGYTKEERKGIENILNAGFIDAFRELHPKEKRYTWWSHWGHARENNVGWRIDYFFVSEKLRENLKSAEIYESFTGSDHCPISITLEF